MTEQEIAAIAARYSRALDAKPSKGPVEHFDWITDSVADIPALLAEVGRLQRLRRFWIGIENQRPAKDKAA